MTHAELFSATNGRKLDGSSGNASYGKYANIFFAMLIDLNSESSSENEFVFETVCYIDLLNQKAEKTAYIKKG